MNNQTLDNLRKQIDEIDDQIIDLLGKRLTLVQKVGEYKKQHNIAARDENRWQLLLEKLTTKGEKLNLSKTFITNLYTTIHEYFIDFQKKL